ncbi:hypothetical protein RJT34_28032 [Clitoria ternatea]|uniref:WIT1/2 N-terminal helical bundle domain-containing protein n=1 Tax=Clitoria ternatea TaxID=43366 RepID=A0AAN9IA19_CLITE
MSTESAEHEIVEAASVDLEGVASSSSGYVIGDLGVICSTMLARMDLRLAFFSEKVSNLSIFMIHLATIESELEDLVFEKDHMGLGSFEKVLTFDLLCGVLDSVVIELDGVLVTLQAGFAEVRERLCSCTHLGEALREMQDKLLGSEQDLKQSEELLNDIKIQSSSFERTLSSLKMAENGFVYFVEGFSMKAGNGEAGGVVREDEESLNPNAELNMQTVEQQRYILRMLDKSLASEIDLEKNIHESREIQENLKLNMFFLEQELVNMEEEAIDIWERWFESDNAREILLGISKGLLGRLHISQFNLNGLSHRESELRAKLETFVEQLKRRDTSIDKIEGSTDELDSSLLDNINKAEATNVNDAEQKLALAKSEISTLSEKVSSLEEKLKESEFQLIDVRSSADKYQKQYNHVSSKVGDMGNLVVELKEALSNAESRADSAESKCKILTETNSKLNEELDLLKGDGGTSTRVDLLERQLKESNLRLQKVIASAKGSQEKQSKLYSTIRDMESVIKDLNSKLSKAESQADSAEENCIILSESNAELNEEVSFLRSRLKCLEGTLHREEEVKITTAKDIGKQTKVLKTLITQLAVERGRLKQRLSSLASENKILVIKLKQTCRDPS